MPSTIPCLSS